MNLRRLNPIQTTLPAEVGWSSLGLGQAWCDALNALVGVSGPTEVQKRAIGELGLVGSRRNLLVSSPTNSGKSLIGWLALIEGLSRGQRVILVEPYRALAQEQVTALKEALPHFVQVIGSVPAVVLTTGDVRLEDSDFTSPPPSEGQLIVATPERLASILQNPENDAWLQSIGTIVVDEAHLLAELKRGPTLEWVMTWFRSRPDGSPRFVMMSATIGDSRAVEKWMAPCDVLQSSQRQSTLERSIICLGLEDAVDESVIEWASEALEKRAGATLLIFVYQTRSAVKLAEILNQRLGASLGPAGALAYHARMPMEARQRVRSTYQSEKSRCLVCTTALAAGVNLPATHVLVRDLTFPGLGSVSADQLLQMAGRAGRRNKTGHAAFLLRPTDARSVEQLTEEIEHPKLKALESSLVSRSQGDPAEAAAAAVLGYLARMPADGVEIESFRRFWSSSLAGDGGARIADAATAWLKHSSRLLAHQENDRVLATRLGRVAAKTAMPPGVVAGAGQLIRDLLQLEAGDQILGAWTPLDSLILIELLAAPSYSLRRYSQELKATVQNWMESSSVKSVLYREWLRGEGAEEVLNSLGLELPSPAAQSYAMLAVMRAIVLWELSNGARQSELNKRWKLDIEGVEERWRDERLWHLSGIAEIFEVKCFFYFLKAELQSTEEKILKTKRLLQRMRLLTYEALGRIKFCSPIGGFVFQAKKTGARLGIGSAYLAKLDALGLTSPIELERTPDHVLFSNGIPERVICQLRAYLRRRFGC